jgi:predicted Zn-dependent protease
MRAYATERQFQKADQVLTKMLQTDPDNNLLLLNLGAVRIQGSNYVGALIPLDQILRLDPKNDAARLNRAIARLQSNQLDGARDDYAALLKKFPDNYAIHYGLGEIARRRNDTRTAIEHFENYLRLVPPDAPEARGVAEQLKLLKTAAR